MKVYVVTVSRFTNLEYHDLGTEVDAVFSSEKRANEYAKTFLKDENPGFVVVNDEGTWHYMLDEDDDFYQMYVDIICMEVKE